jgi:hypothetical protein
LVISLALNLLLLTFVARALHNSRRGACRGHVRIRGWLLHPHHSIGHTVSLKFMNIIWLTDF